MILQQEAGQWCAYETLCDIRGIHRYLAPRDLVYDQHEHAFVLGAPALNSALPFTTFSTLTITPTTFHDHLRTLTAQHIANKPHLVFHQRQHDL